ncbi:MAG: M1 family metallopeptidase, partial [Promethearchaeota archaeon]
MKDTIPIHYDIHLEPDLVDFTFDGTCIVTFNLKSPIKSLQLDATRLKVNTCYLITADGQEQIEFEVKEKEEKLLLSFKNEVKDSVKIKIEYAGELNNRLVGFYRSKYIYQGKEDHVAVTQFEETHAREAFPCFDHPSFKSTFSIEYVIKENLFAISNMPISEEISVPGGKKLVKFEKTPKMTTYLLFFGVGNFEYIEDSTGRVKHRVITTPGKVKYGKFALEFSKKVLEFGESYTGVQFPLPKMDNIGIPDFAFGAMENYGAITYRENLLLVYPGKTSNKEIERIAEVIAHEWAHQWFGNLVSPADWKYLWLNESFATLFGYAITDHYYPEWHIWEQFLVDETNDAFFRDGLASTIPVELPGEGDVIKIDPSSAPIIYSKGGSILFMLKDYLGEENFKKGINNFLKKYAFNIAFSNNYWDAIEEATSEPIREMMESWIYQAGYPIIKARTNYQDGTLELEQKRFVYSNEEFKNTWVIPVKIKYLLENGKDKVVKILFKDKQTSIKLPDDVIAYKINPEQAGFYRVQYDKKNLDQLQNLVKSKKLSPRDRFGIQNDLFAISLQDPTLVETYLSFLTSYKDEDNYLPLSGIATNLFKLYSIASNKRNKIKKIGREIFENALNKIGLEPRSDDHHVVRKLRADLTWQAFKFGSEIVKEFGIKKVEALFKGEPIDSDMLTVVMKLAAAMKPKSFEWFINKLKDPSTPESERIKILVALGSFQDKETLK